ncbi:MAG: hypothetical protein GY944_30910 [bacterium]|nr:hypothetical protein [bacterium]
MSLTYHAATETLLDTTLVPSRSRSALIERVERSYGFTFPASLREWYSIPVALAILEEHSNADPPIGVEEMLGPRTDTIGGGPHDLLSRGLIPIRYENQGVAVWAVRLDGTDDPPVVVDVDTQFREWKPCASSFSEYVYTCVWDYRKVLLQDASVCTDNIPFDQSQLAFLRSRFAEYPTTFGWARDQTYRFYRGGQAIMLWADEVADWNLGADTEEQLHSLIATVGHLESLQDHLYTGRAGGKRVLERLRAVDPGFEESIAPRGSERKPGRSPGALRVLLLALALGVMPFLVTFTMVFIESRLGSVARGLSTWAPVVATAPGLLAVLVLCKGRWKYLALPYAAVTFLLQAWATLILIMALITDFP